ncbi:MAG TPA: hypothetical protein DEP04_05805 [Dehalococcoidia bacterium]|nr:hypothetical protein [Dehalococcoidia bacterium]|tara:strand:- start:1744 stop:2247 length:504 start_codon:yes stop_codon:yes gene_type:complete
MEEAKKFESEIPEFNPDTHRWDWELKKVVELTPEELAQIARRKRKDDLEERLRPLITNNTLFIEAFGWEYSVNSLGEKSVVPYGERMKRWDRDDLDDFEQKVLKLEAVKKEMDDKEAFERPMLNRKNEYRKIDEMLLEGLAEQEEGRPQMLARYMTLRRAIKEKFPK